MNARLKNPLNIDIQLHSRLPGEATERPVALLAPPPALRARKILVCADSGYCHLVAVIPREAKLNLERISKLLGGARVAVVGPCSCGKETADFPPDTIIDASLAGHDFELELEPGVETVIHYAEFEQRRHPLVATIVTA